MRVSILMLGLCSTLSSGCMPDLQYNPESEWRIKAAAVEAAGSQTKVNGVILQIKANSLDGCSCNPIIPRPHVLKAGVPGRGGNPSAFSCSHPIKHTEGGGGEQKG